jgi:Tol biopolymer transport system component
VGAILAYINLASGRGDLYTVDIDYGTQVRLDPKGYNVIHFSWSPDGQQIVVQATVGSFNEVLTIGWDGLSKPQRILTDAADVDFGD